MRPFLGLRSSDLARGARGVGASVRDVARVDLMEIRSDDTMVMENGNGYGSYGHLMENTMVVW